MEKKITIDRHFRQVLKNILEILNHDPDDMNETEMIDEVVRYIEGHGVTL